jgi:hypothetical protein
MVTGQARLVDGCEVAGPAWARELYLSYRGVMPSEVGAVCQSALARDEWDIAAAHILGWAITTKALRPEHKTQAMAHTRAGLLGRNSAHFERRLSTYRPPLRPPGRG